MTESNISPQRLTILGSTGSIGQSTLDVIRRHRERYVVFALTAARQADVLLEQVIEFSPRFAVLVEPERARWLAEALVARGSKTRVLSGAAALEEVAAASEVDAVMAAIVGAAGLPATLAAARAGKKILLANKESLVMAGPVFLAAAREGGATLLPIDSEHNAVFQALPRGFDADCKAHDLAACGVRRIVLTASGGPFRNASAAELEAATPAAACAHPNWSMGRKISVDSATMMNKGLEVIEACLLFGARADQVEVVVHPQSVIHSMVEYADGSVIAQLGNPDMRTPIAHALAYPERMEAGVSPLDLCAIGSLSFQRADTERFPCLALAYQALREGGAAPAVLNAANEVAVEAFLAGGLRFTAIASVIRETLEAMPSARADDLETVFETDRRSRDLARAALKRYAASIA